MDRDSINKVIKKMLIPTYPTAYKKFTRETFSALADSMQEAFANFPNLAVEVEYERWCREQKYPPTISDIAPKLYATLPNRKDDINDPHKWKSYTDEEGRFFVIAPKGSEAYERMMQRNEYLNILRR